MSVLFRGCSASASLAFQVPKRAQSCWIREDGTMRRAWSVVTTTTAHASGLTRASPTPEAAV